MPRKKSKRSSRKTAGKNSRIFSKRNAGQVNERYRVSRKELVIILVMVIIYVLLGDNFFKEIVPNPMVPGAVVAINMIVVVIAGILFGRKVGLGTGLVGTFINALVTSSSGIPSAGFEFAAIIPHAIMGWSAGYLREKNGIIVSSLAILIGHVLNILMFLLTGLLAFSALSNGRFWIGLGYEAVLGIISISIIVWLYLKIFHKK